MTDLSEQPTSPTQALEKSREEKKKEGKEERKRKDEVKGKKPSDCIKNLASLSCL